MHRRQQQRSVGGAVAAPAADGGGGDHRGQEQSDARGAGEQRRGTEARDIAGVAVPHHDQHQQAVDAEHHPVRGQPGERPRDGGDGEHRARAVQPSGRHRVRDRPVDGRALLACGPSTCGENRTDSTSATDTGMTTRRMIAAAPVSPAPKSDRGTSMKPAPRDAAAMPVAVATEFIVTTVSRGTTSGSAADRPEETNRVKPLAISAPNKIGRSAGAGRQQCRDAEHQHQPPEVRSDEHQPPVPAVEQRARERPQQRVGEEQHGERGDDLPRARGAVGVEQQRTRKSGLKQAVAELARRAQLEQSREFGRGCAPTATGPPVRVRQPREFTVQISRRVACCSPPSTFAGDIMVGWRSQRIRRISSLQRRTGCAPEPCCLANTDLLEPTFRRSVIYIVEHNDGGTLGVVLNRPSETAVYNVLPQWAKLATKPKTMFIGGPVKRDAALCLATLRVGTDPTGVPGIRHVQGRMVMVDLDAEPETIAPIVEGVRIFAGYSGWTIGQLEGEIERDDWIVLSALPSDVLAEARVDLWGRVLRRQPLPLSLLATHPIDISRN